MQISLRPNSWPLPLLVLLLSTLLATLAFAQDQQQQSDPVYRPTSNRQQPIIHPTREEILIPGSTYTIRWTPDKHFSNITLELWDKTSWGYSRDFGELCYHWVNPFCGTIVSHAPNTGSFDWHIPKPGSDFPRIERDFWIKMYVDDYLKPDIGNKDPVLSYSQNFGFGADPGQQITISYNDATMTSSSATVSRSSANGLGMSATGTYTTTSTAGTGPVKNSAATDAATKPTVSAKLVAGSGASKGTTLYFRDIKTVGWKILLTSIVFLVFWTVG